MVSYQDNHQDVARDGKDGRIGDVDGQDSYNHSEDAMDTSIPASNDDVDGNLPPAESKLEENSSGNGSAEMEFRTEDS